MAKLNLKFMNQKETKKKLIEKKDQYNSWREFRKETQQNYIMIPTEMAEYLSCIYTRAFSLYIYYFFRAKNETGISWPSVAKAAEDLNVSTRSINNWNEELERLGLIARISEGKSSKTTYLLPISDFYYHETNTTVEDYIDNTEEKLEGELKGIIHLFQWRKNKKTDIYDVPYNVVGLIFEKKGISLDNEKKFFTMKAVLIEDPKVKDYHIENKADAFKHDVYKFKSELQLKQVEVLIYGIAVSSKINLMKEQDQDVLNLLQDLNNEFSSLKDLPEIE